jgi:hypothetical protein
MYAKKIEYGTKEYLSFVDFLANKLNQKIIFDDENEFELEDRIDEFCVDIGSAMKKYHK